MHFLLACCALATADQQPPSYERVLAHQATATVEAFNEHGRYAEAVEWGSGFQSQVLEHADIAYEVAYAWNALGDGERARRHFRAALALDPDHAASWYDLGELLLLEGQLDGAEHAFQRAAELRPDHWAGPFRLAEIAARRGEAERFEQQLRAALQEGFSFRVVVGDARWHGYYAQPELREVIRQLVTVYSDERLLDAFQEAAPAP